MPYVIKRGDEYRTQDGRYVPEPGGAIRFRTKDDATAAKLMPAERVVADVVRRGIDRPCALHKGPAGDCQPWNCVCY